MSYENTKRIINELAKIRQDEINKNPKKFICPEDYKTGIISNYTIINITDLLIFRINKLIKNEAPYNESELNESDIITHSYITNGTVLKLTRGKRSIRIFPKFFRPSLGAFLPYMEMGDVIQDSRFLFTYDYYYDCNSETFSKFSSVLKNPEFTYNFDFSIIIKYIEDNKN